MNSLAPKTYAEAVKKQESRVVKPRTALKRRSDKAILRDVAAGGSFLEKTSNRIAPRRKTPLAGRIARAKKGKKEN